MTPEISQGSGKTLLSVTNWHHTKQTLDFVKMIRTLDLPDVDIFVFDNESTPETLNELLATPDMFEGNSNNTENIGFTGGSNAGLAYAAKHGYEFIVWLNTDLEFGPDSLKNSIAFMRSNEDVSLASPIICDLVSRDPHFVGCQIDKMSGSIRFPAFDEVEQKGYGQNVYVYGTALFARVDDVKTVGGFNEKYFIYSEDMHLCDVMLSSGKNCRIIPNARVYHDNQHTDDEDLTRSKYFHYYMTRNKIWFYWTQFPKRVGLKLIYWHYDRARKSIRALKQRNKITEASAIRDGLFDALLYRTGRWSKHPPKKA